MKLSWQYFSFRLFRDGRLEVGDEIVNINGSRVRGLSPEDVSQLLETKVRHSCQLDLLIARENCAGGGTTPTVKVSRDQPGIPDAHASVSSSGAGAKMTSSIEHLPNLVKVRDSHRYLGAERTLNQGSIRRGSQHPIREQNEEDSSLAEIGMKPCDAGADGSSDTSSLPNGNSK